MDQRGYQDAAAVLPLRLRREAMALPEDRQALAEELRLRVGRAMTVLLPEGEVPFTATVEQEDLEGLCNIASDFSRYAAAESLRRGYLSVRGGCRVGLCGSAVMKEGETVGLRDFYSAAIRIPPFGAVFLRGEAKRGRKAAASGEEKSAGETETKAVKAAEKQAKRAKKTDAKAGAKTKAAKPAKAGAKARTKAKAK